MIDKVEETKKVTLLRIEEKGEPVEEEFDADHAKRILNLQKQTGLVAYKEPDSKPEPEQKTESTNADNRPTGDTVNTEASQRGGPKKGS